jgi:tRNA (cmo5U34)-methyltransferase
MSLSRFDPVTYLDTARTIVPNYDDLQHRVARATAHIDVADVLDLGTGTGETLAQVLPFHPGARTIGVDGSEDMLAAARVRLIEYNVRLLVADLSDPLPPGPFNLVVSVLAIHHLDAPAKAALFARVAGVLAPGGRFVLGDVVVPPGPDGAGTPPEHDYDKPSPVEEQVGWLRAAGLAVTVRWQEGNLAVLTADRPDVPY